MSYNLVVSFYYNIQTKTLTDFIDNIYILSFFKALKPMSRILPGYFLSRSRPAYFPQGYSIINALIQFECH